MVHRLQKAGLEGRSDREKQHWRRSQERGIVVTRILKAKAFIVFICIVTLGITAACFASGTVNEPGDSGNLPPASEILEPTPVILSDFAVVLAAVVSLAVY